MRASILIDCRDSSSKAVNRELGVRISQFLPINGQLILTRQFSEFKRNFSAVFCSVVVPTDYVLSPVEQAALDGNYCKIIRSTDNFGVMNYADFNNLDDVDCVVLLNGNSFYESFSYDDAIIFCRTLVPSEFSHLRFRDNQCYMFNGSFCLSVKTFQALTEAKKDETFSFNNVSDFICSLDFCEFLASENFCIEGWSDIFYLQMKGVTSRYFNDITVSKTQINKRSDNINKTLNEARWFREAPAQLQCFLPKLISERIRNEIEAEYVMQRVPGITLSDLFVFCDMPDVIWEDIFRDTNRFLGSCRELHRPSSAVNSVSKSDLFVKKTISRLENFIQSHEMTWDTEFVVNNVRIKKLRDIIDDMEKIVSSLEEEERLFHGDFCFSNILYESKLNAIYVIDPRASDNTGEFSLYGDLSYDYCKFFHSLFGLYDLIANGYFNVTFGGNGRLTFELFQNPKIVTIQGIFDELALIPEAYKIKILRLMPALFLSMLPLHAENPERQFALFANGLLLSERNYS